MQCFVHPNHEALARGQGVYCTSGILHVEIVRVTIIHSKVSCELMEALVLSLT